MSGKSLNLTPSNSLLQVLPLATALGLKVDTSCGRDDEECVINAVEAYASTPGSRNVLICWEHKALTKLASELGIEHPPSMHAVAVLRSPFDSNMSLTGYPSHSFNYIWTIQDRKMISNTTSQDCPGLDA